MAEGDFEATPKKEIGLKGEIKFHRFDVDFEEDKTQGID